MAYFDDTYMRHSASMNHLQHLSCEKRSQHVQLCFLKKSALQRLIKLLQLFMVNDTFPAVRAEAIRALTSCLANVKTVPIR